MCGINGIVSNLEITKENLYKQLQEMNSLIDHRGPDDDGFFVSDNRGYYNIGMAMRRLSIIDLEGGQQPIYSEDKKKVIVFNGEIYNFLNLKENLESEGVIFNTHSDTEVVLKLYEVYGIKAFSMLDGMFALSIYDEIIDTLFIARDFFGEKPLYYTKTDSSFLYGSELKSLLPSLENLKISNEGLNLYFQLSYVPAPYTIYEDIYKLEANHFIAFNCKKFSVDIQKIPQEFKTYDKKSFKDAAIINRDLVLKSVTSRSITDVPLGTFLSGGVDSSIVSYCLAKQSSSKIDTFSIGFKKKAFDESDKARTVSKLIGSNHHEFIIGEDDISSVIHKVLNNFDEPFADSSALPSYIVANKTSQYVKVALTGDGGDEIYGGYNKYLMGKLNSYYTKFIPKSLHNNLKSGSSFLLNTKDDNRGKRFKIQRLIKAVDYNNEFYYNIISLAFQKTEINDLLMLNKSVPDVLNYYKDLANNNATTLNDFRAIDKIISLEGDMLVKVDRTSMLNSLECRSPFLNKALWNFTNQLPQKYLLNGWNKKRLLKNSFETYFPDKFFEKSKQGFGVPVGDWLRHSLKDELLSYVDESFLVKQAIFNSTFIKKIVSDHVEGRVDNTFRVWSFYCFQKWYVKKFD